MGSVPRHVVIPVRVEDTNPTLAIAIASIRKHTTYDIVTIGHDHGLAEHIPMVQSSRHSDRFANTDHAMRIACEHHPTFIWSADDTYWTRPAEPIRWALGNLTDVQPRDTHTRRKATTAQWLIAQGLPTWDYEAHVPMLIEAAPMLTALEHTNADPMLNKRSLYGNLTGQPDMIAPDVKIYDDHTPIPDTPWLSSSRRNPTPVLVHLAG